MAKTYNNTGLQHRRWQADSAAKECPHCQLSFTFIRRKHHCRLCGFVVCGACSRHKSPLPSLGYFKCVRVCDKCVFKYISICPQDDLSTMRFPKSPVVLSVEKNAGKCSKFSLSDNLLGLPSSEIETAVLNKPFTMAYKNTKDSKNVDIFSSMSKITQLNGCFGYPRIWVPDEYAYGCFGCGQAFDLITNRRHQ
jgi:hypothetical protein